MKPVAIFRHIAFEGPGYLAQCLDRHEVPWQLVRVDAGEAVPSAADGFSGLVFMGGPMSVHDGLPWIAQELALIRDAYARDIPLLGHCLGGQLISLALGGRVTRNPLKEIGWGEVKVSDNAVAREWFGDSGDFEAFHWHGETFTPPPGAVHLLASAYCANQAYAMGKHLALQCHVEMTGQMVREWAVAGMGEISASLDSPAVQTAEMMQAQMPGKLPPMQRVAEQLYRHWLRGVAAGGGRDTA